MKQKEKIKKDNKLQPLKVQKLSTVKLQPIPHIGSEGEHKKSTK